MPYKLALVDDKPHILSSLSRELTESGRAEIVFTADNGNDFLKKINALPQNKHPQVVLMDVDMPVMNGIEAVRNGSSLYPEIQYIMLTVFDDDDKLFEALKAGAHGYLLKEERANVILNAVEEVIEKKRRAYVATDCQENIKNWLVSEHTPKKEDTAIDHAGLTERETEILKSMVSGLDYRQIGEKLFISPNTVRNHISKIYDKLHISSKTQAVTLAIKNKWI